MKNLLVLACLVALVNSFPAEDPNDQVELIEAENTNTRDPETVPGIGGQIPIIIIKSATPNRTPFFGGFPPILRTFLGGENDSPLFPEFTIDGFNEDGNPVVRVDEEGSKAAGEDDENCGLLCIIFRDLEDRIKKVEQGIKEVQANRENEVEAGNRENVPQTTYEEKVLPDGSVVKINRTTFTDTSDDGSTFYGFHSTHFISSDDGSEEETPSVASEEDTEVAVADENKIATEKLTSRTKRSDPFNQQVEDVSFLNQLQPDAFNQAPQQTRRVWPRAQLPPVRSLAGDTRVNDLLLENSRRGGLIKLEPDAEFINRDQLVREQVQFQQQPQFGQPQLNF